MIWRPVSSALFFQPSLGLDPFSGIGLGETGGKQVYGADIFADAVFHHLRDGAAGHGDDDQIHRFRDIGDAVNVRNAHSLDGPGRFGIDLNGIKFALKGALGPKPLKIVAVAVADDDQSPGVEGSIQFVEIYFQRSWLPLFLLIFPGPPFIGPETVPFLPTATMPLGGPKGKTEKRKALQ